MKKLQPQDTRKFFIDGKGILTIRMDRSYPYPTGSCKRWGGKSQEVKAQVKQIKKVA